MKLLLSMLDDIIGKSLKFTVGIYVGRQFELHYQCFVQEHAMLLSSLFRFLLCFYIGFS